jgi:hypothetical protein
MQRLRLDARDVPEAAPQDCEVYQRIERQSIDRHRDRIPTTGFIRSRGAPPGDDRQPAT